MTLLAQEPSFDETWRAVIYLLSVLFSLAICYFDNQSLWRKTEEVKKWLVNVCNYYKTGTYVQVHVLLIWIFDTYVVQMLWIPTLCCMYLNALLASTPLIAFVFPVYASLYL